MDKEILKSAAKWQGFECDEYIARLEEGYLGEYDSREKWAAEHLDGVLPEDKLVQLYFDYEAYTRDADLSGEIFFFEYGSKVHVFLNS